MNDCIYLFYKHFNTYKTKKRSVIFPSFVYKNYIVPIDEYTYNELLSKMETIIDENNMGKYDPKTIKLFEQIVKALSHVNVNEFE